MKQSRSSKNSILTSLGIHCEEWSHRPEWLEYAQLIWKGEGRVEELRDGSAQRRAFIDRATRSFTERGVPTVRLRTWVNVMPPDDRDGYDKGYPHVHADETAITLVHYLQVPEGAGELDIFHEDQKYSIAPTAGSTIYIPNGVLHGVTRNRGKKNRVAFIATAYPL